ncbi:MAG: DUF3575 domain-containing protein [Rikenellaceae bacterium]
MTNSNRLRYRVLSLLLFSIFLICSLRAEPLASDVVAAAEPLASDDVAAAAEPLRDTVTFFTTIYFTLDQGDCIEHQEVIKANEALEWSLRHPQATITIEGWTDRAGSLDYNQRLSLRRASTLQRYMVDGGVDPQRITSVGCGVDTVSESITGRRADFVAIYSEPRCERVCEVAAAPEAKPTAEIVPEPAVEIDPEPAVKIAPETLATAPIYIDELQPFSRFSLRTNLLYWLGGVMNIGGEWRGVFHERLSLVVSGGYSALADDDWRYRWGMRYIQPELRCYLGEARRWFVGGEFLYCRYDIKLSGSGHKGKYCGGGAVGGYRTTLTDRFAMDFTAGVGIGTNSLFIPFQLGANLIFGTPH